MIVGSLEDLLAAFEADHVSHHGALVMIDASIKAAGEAPVLEDAIEGFRVDERSAALLAADQGFSGVASLLAGRVATPSVVLVTAILFGLEGTALDPLVEAWLLSRLGDA